MKFGVRTSAQPGLPNIWSSASELPLDCTIFWSSALQCLMRSEVSLQHFRSALSAKDLRYRFRTSAQPGLPKVWSSASALPLCLDYQRSELPFPHFRFAWTAKYLKIRFYISALSGLPKIWISVSSLSPDQWRCEGLLLHFRCTFILHVSTQFKLLLFVLSYMKD